MPLFGSLRAIDRRVARCVKTSAEAVTRCVKERVSRLTTYPFVPRSICSFCFPKSRVVSGGTQPERPARSEPPRAHPWHRHTRYRPGPSPLCESPCGFGPDPPPIALDGRLLLTQAHDPMCSLLPVAPSRKRCRVFDRHAPELRPPRLSTPATHDQPASAPATLRRNRRQQAHRGWEGSRRGHLRIQVSRATVIRQTLDGGREGAEMSTIALPVQKPRLSMRSEIAASRPERYSRSPAASRASASLK